MILSYMRKFPWGEPTDFKQKIKSSVKKHTFRLGFRWSAGNVIDFWDGSPRAVKLKPKPEPFFLDYNLADRWKTINRKGLTINLPLVFAVEKFWMKFTDMPNSKSVKNQLLFQMKIGELNIGNEELLELVATADGFDDRHDFIRYFNDVRKKFKTNILVGQVIHWTESSIYDPDTAEIIKSK